MSITSAISKVYVRSCVGRGVWGLLLSRKKVSVWRELPTMSNPAEGAGEMRTENYPLHMARTSLVSGARAAPGE